MPSDWEVIEDSQSGGGDWEVLDEQPKAEIITPITVRERKATARGGAFDWYGKIKKSAEEDIATGRPSFLKQFGLGVQAPLALSTGAFRLGTGALSDIALGVTEKKPQDIPRHLAETFTGKRTAQMSDVAESLGMRGFPAQATGFAAEFGLSNLLTAGRLGKVASQVGKKGIKSVGQGISRIIETTKEGFKTLKGLKLPRTATLESAIQKTGRTRTERLMQLTENKVLAQDRLTKLKDMTQEVFDDNLKNLEVSFQDAYEGSSLKLQQLFPKFKKSMMDSYDEYIDEISENVAIQRGNINIQEANDILRKTVEESFNDNLNYGQGFEKINNLMLGKYGVSTSNLNKTFTLKEFKADLGQIFKSAKYGRLSASEEIPVHILRKNFGQFATDITTNVYGVSDYAVLQQKYANSVDALKLYDKIFQPLKGELYSQKGAEFLRKFGMAERPPLAQTKLMQQIEEGGELGQGIGKVSQEVRKIGTEMRQIREANKLMKTNIAQRIDNLGIRSMQVKNSVKLDFDKRIDELSDKLAQRKNAVALARMLGLGGAAVAGAYGVGKTATNILGFRESYGE